MDRSSIDEAMGLLTRAQRGVLLAVPETPSTDAFAAMLALSLALERLGKPTTMVSPSFVPDHLQFLPGTSQIRERIEAPAEAIVELPLGDVRPRDVDWEIADGTLRITVRANTEFVVDARDIRVRSGAYPWDAAITIGAQNLDALGALATEHTRLFRETPILNIDCGTANGFFGATNLVSPTAGTVSELVLELLEALGGEALEPEMATCLFAGIAAATDSFRTPTLTPRTFHAASRLLGQHADHQTVVRHLFKTHTLPELRLLGRALARLEELAPDTVLATISENDFAETEATPDAAPSILKEILEWVGRTRTVLLAFSRSLGTFEVLAFLGHRTPEEREAFRARLDGAAVGPFILVNLGRVTPEQLPQAIRERLLARASESDGAGRVRPAVAVSASDTAGAASVSPVA